MPSTSIYLSGPLDMPNGQSLWADEIDIEVEFEIERGYDNPNWADVDFEVVDVNAPIIATDDRDNEVVLQIDATHPAIRKLIRQKSRKIEDDCLDAAQFEDA